MESVYLTPSILEKEKMRARAEGRSRSRLRRINVINFFQQKKIALSEFVMELFNLYSGRKQDKCTTVSVSIKLPPYQLVFMDLEVYDKQRFINRSEFIRSAINDYVSTHGDNGMKEILKGNETPSVKHDAP